MDMSVDTQHFKLVEFFFFKVINIAKKEKKTLLKHTIMIRGGDERSRQTSFKIRPQKEKKLAIFRAENINVRKIENFN